MDLKRAIKHSLKHINILCMVERYTVARILMFRGYKLKQNNNGADIYNVDSTTISDIYQFMKSRLIRLFLSIVYSNIYTTMVAKRGRPSKILTPFVLMI